MSLTIDQWFIDMFESEVHSAYQRKGAKLETMVRTGGMGAGKRVWFPTMAKGKAGSKARHGQVAFADRGETGVWCNISDAFWGDMVDEVDELKTNVAARSAYSRDHAWIMGRKADQIIIDAMDTTTNDTTNVGVITLAKINEVFTFFGDNAVPMDGERYAAVSAKGWTDLMALTEFSSMDYVPEGEMPYRGAAGTAKRWMSFYWFVQEGTDTDDGALPKTGNIRTGFAWHQSAVGYHKQNGPSTKMAWENKEQATSIVTTMSCGACLIDADGCYKILHDETATPA